MNAHDQPDPILRLLADLTPMTPSAATDRRVLARCHAKLARHRTSQAGASQPRARRTTVFDLALAAGIGGYGVIAAIEAVRLALVR